MPLFSTDDDGDPMGWGNRGQLNPGAGRGFQIEVGDGDGDGASGTGGGGREGEVCFS